MPDLPNNVTASGTAAVETEPEIQIIPEKYYGAALKAHLPEQAEATGAEQRTPNKRNFWIILAIFILILGAGGAFIYFNPSLLSPAKPAVKPMETPVVVIPPPQPPSAPSDTKATSTNPQSVAVTWIDTAANESGFRIERAEEAGVFASITNLPPNSTSFLDNSVVSAKAYRYRIIALNQDGESAPSPEAQALVQAVPVLPEQPKLPPAGLDTDSDGLSDLEEKLFATEARNPDTDGDGFLDGNEVFHLYNPNGRAPSKLIDAKLVQIVTNPVGWSMQTPVGWEVKIAQDGLSASFFSTHGETFNMSIEDNAKRLPLLDWYLAKHPDVKAAQVMQYRSKQGYEGIIGADVLSTFIPWGDRIFVFTYSLGDQPFINYRTTYSMILNSLILNGLPQIIVGTQTGTLPFEPAATTPGVVTQPQPVEVFYGVTGTQAATTTDLTGTSAATSSP